MSNIECSMSKLKTNYPASLQPLAVGLSGCRFSLYQLSQRYQLFNLHFPCQLVNLSTFSLNVKLVIKRTTVLLNILRRIHAEEFIELGPEVFDIADAHFKRGLVHIAFAL
jgi:hypothetical protein